MTVLHRSLLAGSLAGALLFGAVFALTFVRTSVVERTARGFVVSRIELELKRRKVSLQSFGDRLSSLKARYAQELGAAHQQLSSGLRLKIEEVLSKICDLDCLEDQGVRIQDVTEHALASRIAELKNVSQKLTALIQGKYYRLISELLQDIRIFSGCNLLLFLLIFLALYRDAAAARPLVLPAGLLFVATLISSAVYIYGQNWFYTLLFSSYMGWGYLTYVAVIFGFLVDIVFNGAEITTGILDGIASALEGLLSCIPGC